MRSSRSFMMRWICTSESPAAGFPPSPATPRWEWWGISSPLRCASVWCGIVPRLLPTAPTAHRPCAALLPPTRPSGRIQASPQPTTICLLPCCRHELGWHPKTHLTHVSGEGCRISGKVTVSRVPGSLRISAQSRVHSFDPLLMNVTHHVDSLLFVSPGQDGTERLLMADAMSYWRRMSAGDRDGLSAGRGMGEAQLRKNSFVMHSQATTLKHYLKVVPTRNVFLGQDQPLDTYQYSSNYAEFAPHRGALEMHLAGEAFEPATLVPQTIFSYDISPLRIVHRQHSEGLDGYLTQLCAVVGGVFTVFGLIDNVVHAGVKAVKQD